jgi:hypothetical protein
MFRLGDAAPTTNDINVEFYTKLKCVKKQNLSVLNSKGCGNFSRRRRFA